MRCGWYWKVNSPMFKIIAKTMLPSILSIILISVALFSFFLPQLKATLVDHKVGMVRSMAQSVWFILDDLQRQVAAGQLSLDQAQKSAKSIINAVAQRAAYFLFFSCCSVFEEVVSKFSLA